MITACWPLWTAPMVFEFDCDPSVGRTAEDRPRLSVGASGALVQFEAPQVYRDVYYLGPGGALCWQAPQSIEAARVVRAGGQRSGLGR